MSVAIPSLLSLTTNYRNTHLKQTQAQPHKNDSQLSKPNIQQPPVATTGIPELYHRQTCGVFITFIC